MTKIPPHDSGEIVEGLFSVQRVTFANPETGWAVVHLVPADKPAHSGFAAVGDFEAPEEGACYQIRGRWTMDPKHGAQVRVKSAIPSMPQSLPALERYLGGASIKGLGPHYAKALIDHFGTETLKELRTGGKDLEEVPGIGPKRAQAIRDSWLEHEGTHQLMINLQGIAQISPRQAQRIHRQYGAEAWEVIRDNPYRLAEDLRGYGFRTCDRIARRLGLAPNSPQRIQAAILHILEQALNDGHLWTSPNDVDTATIDLLSLPKPMVAQQREALLQDGRIANGALPGDPNPKLYLPTVLEAESRSAMRLAHLLKTPVQGLAPNQAREIIRERSEAALTDEQATALLRVLEGTRLVILTGGPGSGKTTTLRSLTRCLESIGCSYALCATTGRASKQLASSTQRNASTVHRHLGIGVPGRDPIKAREHVLIVDESSMIDNWLFDQMLSRIGSHTRLLLVGDIDQLPPVGPGAVLQDLIEAIDAGLRGGAVIRLTKLFRQKAGTESLIGANCQRIRHGIRPRRPDGPEGDYYEMPASAPIEARELAVSLAAQRLPKYLDIPPSEVQVLAPMHGGEAGVQAINSSLQAKLNPPERGKAELPWPSGPRSSETPRVLRVGDKVRQTRNNYHKGILNGDLGQVEVIDIANRVVSVTFDDRRVPYSWDEVHELVHAWAMTVHAAQGSQWPAVVVIMLTNHYVMLERNILYTALSRAERLAVLITQEKALRIAVSRDLSSRRRTGLTARLHQAVASLA